MVRIITDYENDGEEFWAHLRSYDVTHTATISQDWYRVVDRNGQGDGSGEWYKVPNTLDNKIT